MASLVGVRYIPDAKLTGYLLNSDHPEGGSKARFFLSRGFDPNAPEILAAALLQHANTHPVFSERLHDHGISRVIRCHLPTPDGTNPCIYAVWLQEPKTTAQRLVSAYPAK